MRVLESNKRRQPETRQQQLLNQESKNTPSLCSFLLRHHSLPSPPQKAGPTACAGMCCSRPAGGGVVQVEWLAQLLRRLLLGPARNARVIKGMIGTLGTNAQTRARANRSRAWVAAVSLVLLLLLLLLLLCRRMCCRRPADCYNYGTVRAARPDDVRRRRTPHTHSRTHVTRAGQWATRPSVRC